MFYVSLSASASSSTTNDGIPNELKRTVERGECENILLMATYGKVLRPCHVIVLTFGTLKNFTFLGGLGLSLIDERAEHLNGPHNAQPTLPYAVKALQLAINCWK